MSRRAARARARGSWPGRVLKLGEEPDLEVDTSATPSERFAMVWQITLDAWASMGDPMPTYTRAGMPGRVRKLGEQP